MDDTKYTIERILLSSDIFEKARLMKSLKDADVRTNELASALKMKPSYIAHFLRLNKLPEIVADAYYSKLVTPTHLFIIARLPDVASMIRVYERILAESLTSAQTEIVVREELYQTKTEGEKLLPEEVARLDRLVEKHLGKVKLQVIQTRIHSKLVLDIKGSLKDSTATLRKLIQLLSEAKAR